MENEDIELVDLDEKEELTEHLVGLGDVVEMSGNKKRQRRASPPGCETEAFPRTSQNFQQPMVPDMWGRDGQSPGSRQPLFTNAPSWIAALKAIETGRFMTDSMTTILQALNRNTTEKATAMCVFVEHVTPSGKGSGIAIVRDPTGSIEASIAPRVFEHFPQLTERSTLLLQDVVLFSGENDVVCLLLMPQMVIKVFTEADS